MSRLLTTRLRNEADPSLPLAIDIWSLGCIIAELYTGYPIFPGENEQEQLACIMEIFGVPEKYLVDRSSRKKLFFDSSGSPRPVVNSKGKRRRPSTKTLQQVLRCNDELFVDFVAKCLHWDPDRRMKPDQAMKHPWVMQGRRALPTNDSAISVVSPHGPMSSPLPRRTSLATTSAAGVASSHGAVSASPRTLHAYSQASSSVSSNGTAIQVRAGR